MVRFSSGVRKLGFGILIGTLCATASSGQMLGNLDVCRVTTDTWSLHDGRGTGLYLIDKFPVDDISGVTKKVFHYDDNGGHTFQIDVEVEYGFMKDVEKGKPTNIQLSLLARNTSQKDDRSIIPAEANADYRRKWGRVSIETTVVNGDVAQRFGLSCSDGLSKNGLRRGDPSWLKKQRDKQKNSSEANSR